MDALISILTVSVVIFFYLHIVYHLKTSNDLEVYDVELPDKNKLEELCNLRQPLVFGYNNGELLRCSPRAFDHGAFEVNVVDASGLSVPLNLEKARALFAKTPHYTERNDEFLRETMLLRSFECNDFHFRPPLSIQKRYDLLFGGEGASTKLKYSDCYRNYFYAVDGQVQVKLAPPRNYKYLDVQKEYERGEFYSRMSPWSASSEHAKIKFLDVTLSQGQMLFIPAYWFYSFRFSKDGCLCAFQYKTVMNYVATLPDTLIGILQQQNTKIVIAETLPAAAAPAAAPAAP